MENIKLILKGDPAIDKIKAYLERINYHGSLALTAQTLRDLQLAHLLAVPFENLSIHWGEPIVLQDDVLFDKVVGRRRGGFCYELNGLFAFLLRSLGFDVAMLSAGVAESGGGFSPLFDHMVLMVKLNEPWLVDVGFGDTFREPLQIDSKIVQTQPGGTYRIAWDGAAYVLKEMTADQNWKAIYRFNLQGYQYADFAEMCAYHQTSPKSHFTQRRICSRATASGRLTLSEMRFITTSLNGDRQEQKVPNEDAFVGLLNEHFGILAP